MLLDDYACHVFIDATYGEHTVSVLEHCQLVHDTIELYGHLFHDTCAIESTHYQCITLQQ